MNYVARHKMQGAREILIRPFASHEVVRRRSISNTQTFKRRQASLPDCEIPFLARLLVYVDHEEIATNKTWP